MLTARILRAARAAAGMSQADLALAAGCTDRCVRRAEAGDGPARLRPSTRSRLLAALAAAGVAVDGQTITVSGATPAGF